MSTPFKEIVGESDESQTGKLVRKTKEAPYLAVGIVGAILGVAYGAMRFKNRGKTPTSLYLIHLRVAAQGTVVGAISLGVIYSLMKDYVFPDHSKPVQHD